MRSHPTIRLHEGGVIEVSARGGDKRRPTFGNFLAVTRRQNCRTLLEVPKSPPPPRLPPRACCRADSPPTPARTHPHFVRGLALVDDELVLGAAPRARARARRQHARRRQLHGADVLGVRQRRRVELRPLQVPIRLYGRGCVGGTGGEGGGDGGGRGCVRRQPAVRHTSATSVERAYVFVFANLRTWRRLTRAPPRAPPAPPRAPVSGYGDRGAEFGAGGAIFAAQASRQRGAAACVFVRGGQL